MKIIKLGVIGCGNMAQAILQSIANGGMDIYLKSVNADLNIVVSDPDENKLAKILNSGIKNLNVIQSNQQLVAASDYVLLAIKPQNAQAAILDCNFKNKIVISIMAGISIDKINSLTCANKIVRVMPNLNAKINESFSSYTCKGLNESEEAFVCALLSSFGKHSPIAVNQFNAATGIAGSGPAFVFMFVKAFIDVALKHGFKSEEARLMATQTILGSVKQIGENTTPYQIESLIDSVCSKGGTTIEGVNYLTENNFSMLVENAIERSIKRSAEIERNI